MTAMTLCCLVLAMLIVFRVNQRFLRSLGERKRGIQAGTGAREGRFIEILLTQSGEREKGGLPKPFPAFAGCPTSGCAETLQALATVRWTDRT